MKEIKKCSYLSLKIPKHCLSLICEPGRAIVAESGSTIVKVILKKKTKPLYK